MCWTVRDIISLQAIYKSSVLCSNYGIIVKRFSKIKLVAFLTSIIDLDISYEIIYTYHKK